jgi:hypothetical protein
LDPNDREEGAQVRDARPGDAFDGLPVYFVPVRVRAVLLYVRHDLLKIRRNLFPGAGG